MASVIASIKFLLSLNKNKAIFLVKLEKKNLSLFIRKMFVILH